MKKLIAVFAIVAILLTAAPAMAEFYVITVPAKIQSSEVVSTFEVVSAYAVVSSDPVVFYTVPAGKTFILRDIHGTSSDSIDIFENSNQKARFHFSDPNYTINLGSGIPFSSTSSVIIDNNNTNKYYTIMGYLINN